MNGDGFDDVIVGASTSFENFGSYWGRAYVYYGSPTGPSHTAAWTAVDDHEEACFEYSVSTAGDVNGDGYADVIVGAPLYDNGQEDGVVPLSITALNPASAHPPGPPNPTRRLPGSG